MLYLKRKVSTKM